MYLALWDVIRPRSVCNIVYYCQLYCNCSTVWFNPCFRISHVFFKENDDIIMVLHVFVCILKISQVEILIVTVVKVFSYWVKIQYMGVCFYSERPRQMQRKRKGKTIGGNRVTLNACSKCVTHTIIPYVPIQNRGQMMVNISLIAGS